MVARGGSDWKLAAALITMEDQVNAKYPGRAKGSDGSIGDRSHQNRASDHNVRNGYCHALDLTHDPRNGFSSEKFAQAILDAQDPRLSYVISNKKIGSGPKGPSPGKWRPYNGPNPHNHHCHISVNALGETDAKPWNIGDGPVVLKATAPLSAREIFVKEVKEFQFANGLHPDGEIGPQTWAKIKEKMNES